MRSVPLVWKVFIATQLIGLIAMFLTGVFSRLEESAVLMLTWLVLLLPGDILGPLVPRFLLRLWDTPHYAVISTQLLVIVAVNVAFWYCSISVLRFATRTIKGLINR